MMPFVTEELWQRLPNRLSLTNVVSIMLAPYPVPSNIPTDWKDAAAEADMTVVKDAIHDARSLRTEKKLANHIKAAFAFKTTSADVLRALTVQNQDFCTLAKASALEVLGEGSEVPPGCSVKVVSDLLTIVLRGESGGAEGPDVSAELARLRKDVDRLQPLVEQYRRKISVPNYETKVPEAVRISNQEKLGAYEAELLATEQALAALQATSQ